MPGSDCLPGRMCFPATSALVDDSKASAAGEEPWSGGRATCRRRVSAARSHDFKGIKTLNWNLSACSEISVMLMGRSGRVQAVSILADRRSTSIGYL